MKKRKWQDEEVPAFSIKETPKKQKLEQEKKTASDQDFVNSSRKEIEALTVADLKSWLDAKGIILLRFLKPYLIPRD